MPYPDAVRRQAVPQRNRRTADDEFHKVYPLVIQRTVCEASMTLKNDLKYWEIGRREYVRLWRFLEICAPYWRNPSLGGRISQVLQAGG